MAAYITDQGWVVKVDGFGRDIDRAIESEVTPGRPMNELVDALREHDVTVRVLVHGAGGDR